MLSISASNGKSATIVIAEANTSPYMSHGVEDKRDQNVIGEVRALMYCGGFESSNAAQLRNRLLTKR